jgi:hypothetical protein
MGEPHDRYHKEGEKEGNNLTRMVCENAPNRVLTARERDICNRKDKNSHGYGHDRV